MAFNIDFKKKLSFYFKALNIILFSVLSIMTLAANDSMEATIDKGILDLSTVSLFILILFGCFLPFLIILQKNKLDDCHYTTIVTYFGLAFIVIGFLQSPNFKKERVKENLVLNLSEFRPKNQNERILYRELEVKHEFLTVLYLRLDEQGFKKFRPLIYFICLGLLGIINGLWFSPFVWNEDD